MNNLTFEPEGHIYKVNGIVYPSVTQIISHFIGGYYGNSVVSQRARDFGTAVDEACNLYDENDLELKSLHPALKPYLESWKSFLKEHGKMDEIIIDLKTGLKYDWHPLQTAGYALLDRVIAGNLYEDEKGKPMVRLIQKPLKNELWAFCGTPDRVWTSTGKIKHRWAVYLQENAFKVERHEKQEDAKQHLTLFKSMVQIYNYKKLKGLISET